MRVEVKKPTDASNAHPWVSTSFIIVGLGIFALAVFWIRKCSVGRLSLLTKAYPVACKIARPNNKKHSPNSYNSTLQSLTRLNPYNYMKKLPQSRHTVALSSPLRRVAMFNLYQNINKKDQEEREPDVIGHERFYQARSGRSSRKKKRAPRRAHSAAEFPSSTLNAANKRAAFRARSQSSENKSDDGKSTPQRVDSLVKVFFGSSKRQSGVQKHDYSALKTDSGNDKLKAEKQIRNGAFVTCKNRLENNNRYELKTQLDDIGSRADKHWFIVQDNVLGAERLLTLLPLPATCPISPSQATRDTVLRLFRGLQHPYILPVLDIEFWDTEAAIVCPLNPSGSLKDLIYGSCWHDEYNQKYAKKGEGLPLRTVQCLGRQILEGLLFLRNRFFPPSYHLHSGNVIIQNGVARLAGLENPLLGLLPKAPSAPETLSFGYLLFEMTAGYELPGPPTPAHLELELERAPKVAEALEFIFQTSGTPNLEELVRCELFRGVELRELRGASVIQSASPPDVLELLDLVRNPVPPSPLRRNNVVVIEDRRLEDILEEDNEDSDTPVSVVCSPEPR